MQSIYVFEFYWGNQCAAPNLLYLYFHLIYKFSTNKRKKITFRIEKVYEYNKILQYFHNTLSFSCGGGSQYNILIFYLIFF